MKKIAYLGKIQLSDTDFSYLHEAQKLADITCYMEVCPRFLNGAAISLGRIYPKTGIFKAADIYPEFEKYQGFLNLEKFYVVNTPGRFWQLKSIFTNISLLLILLRNHYQTIHITWPLNIYEWPLYILCRKMILTVHDPFPHTGLDTFIVRLRRKLAFALVRRFIILNKTQRRQFIEYYGLKEDNVITSSLSCFSYLNIINPQTATLPDGRYILFSGKISSYKGLDYLLPAMVRVHESFPDIRLIVAGSGKYDFDISSYQALDYIDIRNRFIPEDELVALIQHSEFMVCPYTDATQSGVIMSAFAFGKPVLATNVGGLPEMMNYGEYGMLVKEKDVEALTAGIIRLLSDESLLKTYSANIANDYSTGDLSWKNIAQKLVDEY